MEENVEENVEGNWRKMWRETGGKCGGNVEENLERIVSMVPVILMTPLIAVLRHRVWRVNRGPQDCHFYTSCH
ncbi:hypothetical protein E2C01_060151 [Portunus trituberculatus]|uniref:Uncharacterized protein n=1 Tax=Portunus trituberculatus TaxID=210409 RepID=A0A5B7HAK6_PORTR|nr:hypothetical protein [Portunus trituberculatus]